MAHNYKTLTTSRIEYHFVVAPTADSLKKLQPELSKLGRNKQWPLDERLIAKRARHGAESSASAVRRAAARTRAEQVDVAPEDAAAHAFGACGGAQEEGGDEEQLHEDALRGAAPRKAMSIEAFRTVLNLRNEKLRELDQPPLRDEEFFGARLYSGPSERAPPEPTSAPPGSDHLPRSLAVYLKYNACLRHKGMQSLEDPDQEEAKRAAEKKFREYCEGNTYACTLHAINSAVVKLGKLSQVQKVYRGISNRSLSKELLVPNEYGVRGGVEFAFMSTTPKREVAMQYAEKGLKTDTALVFEVKMGMIDRGADISWLSQYPHEEVRRVPLPTSVLHPSVSPRG